MPHYQDSNEFVVKKEDARFFNQMEQLFKTIKEKGLICENETFKWASESSGYIENANQLIIKKESDSFKIHFWQNPKAYLPFKELCTICFSFMFLEYQNNGYTLKRNK